MMLDSDLNLWLFEMNPSPGLYTTSKVRTASTKRVGKEMVGMQMDMLDFAAAGRPRDELSTADLKSRGSFTPIVLEDEREGGSMRLFPDVGDFSTR